MKKLTDFELAAASAVVCAAGDFICAITDIAWAIKDFQHTPMPHHLPVAFSLTMSIPFFAYSVYLLYAAWKRHKATNRKPVSSSDDIDFRIKLALMKQPTKDFHISIHTDYTKGSI